MNLAELQSMLQELLGAIDQVMQSGEQLTDEFQGEIAKTLQQLLGKIEQLESTEAPIQPTQQPPIAQGMPSSNVEGFAYDDKNNRLFVRFLGDYPNRNGPVYAYDDVPEVIFNLFRSGSVPARTDGKNKWGQWWKGKIPSLGASLYTLIKNGGYAYQRLT